MHDISTNQTGDILAFNDNTRYYVTEMKYFPVIFPKWKNWALFHPGDANYCNTIYLEQASWFDLGLAFKVVSFMWHSSNCIDLLIINNGSVISQRNDNDWKWKWLFRLIVLKDRYVVTGVLCALLTFNHSPFGAGGI